MTSMNALVSFIRKEEILWFLSNTFLLNFCSHCTLALCLMHSFILFSSIFGEYSKCRVCLLLPYLIPGCSLHWFLKFHWRIYLVSKVSGQSRRSNFPFNLKKTTRNKVFIGRPSVWSFEHLFSCFISITTFTIKKNLWT
jgi:hypothetical protein